MKSKKNLFQEEENFNGNPPTKILHCTEYLQTMETRQAQNEQEERLYSVYYTGGKNLAQELRHTDKQTDQLDSNTELTTSAVLLPGSRRSTTYVIKEQQMSSTHLVSSSHVTVWRSGCSWNPNRNSSRIFLTEVVVLGSRYHEQNS